MIHGFAVAETIRKTECVALIALLSLRGGVIVPFMNRKALKIGGMEDIRLKWICFDERRLP